MVLFFFCFPIKEAGGHSLSVVAGQNPWPPALNDNPALLHPHYGYRNLVVGLVATQTNKKVVLPCTGNDLPSISTMGQFPKYSVNI